ncbi:MAG TPA: polysaccharide pyruvyl transferase family protein [Candidatus Acidoferrales bacterium]|jgi:polysaccharide pyruvyl transferase WcaK-like protein|nr:polysaccharide pyruvyl transferase family protein [Candidatus Acidoferrales bacterium]
MMDLALQAWVSGLIELSKFEWMLGAGRNWQPGGKLKLLFSGYSGARNTGADVRVEETLRQVRRILGEGNLDLSVMTQDFEKTRGYFGDARQVHLPDVYPPFLMREVPQHDGVIACEGSMFKSKFANALTTMNIGSLGLAAAQNKLSIGYGGEAGEMDPLLQKMCRRYCRESFIITRNPESQAVLGRLGISSELGTDTAWTFQPHGPEYGTKMLRDAGWDGTSRVLAVCPIDPFFWPVKASLWKGAAHALTGAYKDSHYRGPYFHRSGRDVEAAYSRYISAMGAAVARYRKTHPVFTIVVGMEQLDRAACARLAKLLGGAPVFSSDRFDMYQLVSILRCCHRIVSSRYHAIVTSMPAGVVSAGVTMDERIRNLMHERGHDHLVLDVDDAELEEKLFAVLEALDREAEAIRESMGCTVARNLKMMARMGTYFEEQVARRYPEFPVRTGSLAWEDYLPPLGPALQSLLEVHA